MAGSQQWQLGPASRPARFGRCCKTWLKPAGRVQRGGGVSRWSTATLICDLIALVEPGERGRCPTRRHCAGPARACGSWRRSLWSGGHQVSRSVVGDLLKAQKSVCKPTTGPLRAAQESVMSFGKENSSLDFKNRSEVASARQNRKRCINDSAARAQGRREKIADK